MEFNSIKKDARFYIGCNDLNAMEIARVTTLIDFLLILSMEVSELKGVRARTLNNKISDLGGQLSSMLDN
jgi:FtsZ-binding cell division protein ZapB